MNNNKCFSCEKLLENNSICSKLINCHNPEIDNCKCYSNNYIITFRDFIYSISYNNLSKSEINFAKVISDITSKIMCFRIDNKMSQSEFAKYLNVDVDTIYKFEDGDCDFTIKQLCDICEKCDFILDIRLLNDK